MSNDKVWEEGEDIHVDFSGQKKTARNIGNKSGLTEYADIDLASGYHKSLIWETKDGRKIAIPNLSDSHLLNIIAFIRRRVDNYKKQVAIQALHGLTHQIQMFDEVDDDWIDTAYQRFRENAKELFEMPDEDFLVKYLPIYQKLYREAYRRKILIEVDNRKIPKVESISEGLHPMRDEKPTRRVKVPKPEPTEEELIQDCADAARSMDGIEIPREDWPIAKKVIEKYPEEFGLGSARGPGGDWKRLYLINGSGDT